MNIFLSADPGGIGSAFHRAEEGRKKKSHVLKSLQHYIIMDINKLSGKIIGAAIYERRHGSNCKKINPLRPLRLCGEQLQNNITWVTFK